MYVPSPQLLADTTRREGGFRARVYADSKGLPTQGIGRHHGGSFGDPDITQETGTAWLIADLADADAQAANLVGPAYYTLDIVRREAVIDLTFNMGAKTLAMFALFLQALRHGNFPVAAYQLLVNTSGLLTPYLKEVGGRAVENALRIATGQLVGPRI